MTRAHRFVDATPVTTVCPSGCTYRGEHVADCRAEDCAGCLPRRCPSGRCVCDGCARRLARNVARLPGLYDALELALRRSGPALGAFGGPGAEVPLFVAEHVAEWRDQIGRDVAWWARRVAWTRGVTPPAAGATVTARCRWLGVHLGWCVSTAAWPDRTRNPFAVGLGEVMAELAGRGYALAYPEGCRVVVQGMPGCPEVGCAGTLRALIRATDSLYPSRLVCSADPGHVVLWGRVLTLRKQLEKEAA